MTFSLTCGAWASVPLCDALPLDEASPNDWASASVMEQQAKGRSTTKKSVNAKVLTHPWLREVAMPGYSRVPH